MQINRIELTNFRNHQHLIFNEIGEVLVIVGNNAVGKTNVIEALQLLSMHESFRGAKPGELVYTYTKGEEITSVSIDIVIHNVVNTKQIVYKSDSRYFLYNNKERPGKELLDLLPSVLFTPDDLQIVKGPPERRRDLLDGLGARLSKTFAHIRAEYAKALRHKNSLLKKDVVDRGLLDSWNINLAKLGTSLSKHRKGLFEQLLGEAACFYTQISGGEELSGIYFSSWKENFLVQEEQGKEDIFKERELKGEQKEYREEELYEVLARISEREIAAMRSLAGPHKDDVHFTINGSDVRRFASQGQQRSIALALKMAEIEILRRVSGKEPLLLLDDVMSELDSARREYFVALIRRAGQTVLTTTNLGYFNEGFLKRATVVELTSSSSGSRETKAVQQVGTFSTELT